MPPSFRIPVGLTRSTRSAIDSWLEIYLDYLAQPHASYHQPDECRGKLIVGLDLGGKAAANLTKDSDHSNKLEGEKESPH